MAAKTSDGVTDGLEVPKEGVVPSTSGTANGLSQEPSLQELAAMMADLQARVEEALPRKRPRGRPKGKATSVTSEGPPVVVQPATPTRAELLQAMARLQQQLQGLQGSQAGSVVGDLPGVAVAPSVYEDAQAFVPGNRCEADKWHRDSQSDWSNSWMPTFRVLDSLKRWGVTFSGEKGTDVEEFIASVDDVLHTLPIKECDLLGTLKGVLKGSAKEWYRATQFVSWDEAREAFRQGYGGLDYSIRIRSEMQKRTQGKDELVREFMRSMRGYFARVQPPLGPREQLQIVYANMLPRYRAGIDIDNRDLTLGDLERLALRQEANFVCARNYQPPPRPEDSVCPGLAYKERKGEARGPRYRLRALGSDPATDRSVSSSSEQSEEEALDALEAARDRGKDRRDRAGGKNTANGKRRRFPPRARSTAEVLCFNCRKTGHHWRMCREARTLFCYGCGAQNVAQPDCACTKNGKGES